MLGRCCLVVVIGSELWAQTCDDIRGGVGPKASRLVLYFPTSVDPDFKNVVTPDEFRTSCGCDCELAGCSGPSPCDPSHVCYTAPLMPFDGDELDPSLSGNLPTDPLIDAILETVRFDYCEFDVDVVSTRLPTALPPAWPRTQVVAIGSDDAPTWRSDMVTEESGPFGLAERGNDVGDATAVDFARVWAGSVRFWCGCDSMNADDCGPTTLGTMNATVERWADVLGRVVSHEAAHNYGVRHCEALPRLAGENYADHIMATGVPLESECSTECSSPAPTGCTTGSLECPDRIGPAFFSDTSYGVLARNVGLCIKTVHNWDFVNKNVDSARYLEIDVLTEPAVSTLTVSWVYTGSQSPWAAPVVTAAGTTIFRGSSYNRHRIRWETPKSWSGGPDGLVPTDQLFHVGVAFNSPGPVIVVDTKLRDSSNAELAYHPRMFGYDTGSVFGGPCLFDVTFSNPTPERGPLILANVEVRLVPRLIDIHSMVSATIDEPASRDGRTVVPYRSSVVVPVDGVTVSGDHPITVARLSDPRVIDIEYGGNAGNGDVPSGAAPLNYPAAEGRFLALFPSTYVYITADVIDPAADVTSRLYYQFAGGVPDCNENGIDDMIEIVNGSAPDGNGNGMPDECETQFRRSDFDADGNVVLTDAVASFNYLFQGGLVPSCEDAADANDDGGGRHQRRDLRLGVSLPRWFRSAHAVSRLWNGPHRHGRSRLRRVRGLSCTLTRRSAERVDRFARPTDRTEPMNRLDAAVSIPSETRETLRVCEIAGRWRTKPTSRGGTGVDSCRGIRGGRGNAAPSRDTRGRGRSDPSTSYRAALHRERPRPS